MRKFPHTITYVIKKRMQIDSLMELPKEKRPPDVVIWSNNPQHIEDWLNEQFNRDSPEEENRVTIPLSMIE